MPCALGRTCLLTTPICRARSLHWAQVIPTEMPLPAHTGRGSTQHYFYGSQLSFSCFCVPFSTMLPQEALSTQPRRSHMAGRQPNEGGHGGSSRKRGKMGLSTHNGNWLEILTPASFRQPALGEKVRGWFATPAKTTVTHKEPQGILRPSAAKGTEASSNSSVSPKP